MVALYSFQFNAILDHRYVYYSDRDMRRGSIKKLKGFESRAAECRLAVIYLKLSKWGRNLTGERATLYFFCFYFIFREITIYSCCLLFHIRI